MKALRNTKPRLTVGMPVYNGERWLPEALDSLLEQSFKDFTLVISDNCSTDGTQEICERYAKTDGRIVYRRQPSNIGIFGNYNAVFENIQTDYFKWASGNDVCLPRFLEVCIDCLDKDDAVALAFTGTLLFDDESGKKVPYGDAANWELGDPIERYRNFWATTKLNNIMNGVIRTDALRRTQLSRPFQGSDQNMVADLLLQGRAVIIEEPLFIRRITAEASTFAKSRSDHDAYYSDEPVQVLRFQALKRLSWGVYGATLAPRDLKTKLRAFFVSARRLVRNRDEIFKELKRS